MHTVTESHGHRILTVNDGTTLASEADGLDLINEAFNEQADVVVVPAERVDDRFFDLRSRVAGDVVLKFAGYRVRLVILGDLAARLEASENLAAFVRETNKGRDIWFLPDHDALEQRLRR
jgi:Domain of unknown function (DUF4180)